MAGPGYVTTECCPLRVSAASCGNDATASAADGAADDDEEAQSRRLLSRPSAMSLEKLCSTAGDMPLRGWRLCTITGLSKPPRAEYCVDSRRIVLRMEHYCVLLGTCIGLGNQHYAIRLLGFVCVSTAYVALSAARVLLSGAAAIDSAANPAVSASSAPAVTVDPPAGRATAQEAAAASAEAAVQEAVATGGTRALSASVSAAELDETAMLAILGACSALVLLCAAQLLLSHLSHIRRGLTHVEARRGAPSREYDLGALANFQAVFGHAPCGVVGCILLPIIHMLPLPWSAVGDGMAFASRPQARRV